MVTAGDQVKNLAAMLTWCREEDRERIKEIMRKIEEENR